MAAPAEGFRWKKQPTGDANAKMEVFAAAKEGGDAAVILVVGKEAADTDAKRIAQIKGEYNGTIVGLQKLGVTDLKGNPAPVKPPIGNKASFVLFGKDGQGKVLYERVVLVFGKWSYHFQVVARSEEQLNQLSKVADTLKEE